VRLTRPAVIVSWLPAYSVGENHGDHQAASVLATVRRDALDLKASIECRTDGGRGCNDPRLVGQFHE